jgi:hypothetical protein
MALVNGRAFRHIIQMRPLIQEHMRGHILSPYRVGFKLIVAQAFAGAAETERIVQIQLAPHSSQLETFAARDFALTARVIAEMG